MKNPENTPDYELIDAFVSKKEPQSRNAFRAFHDRHMGFMLSVARELCYHSFPRDWEDAAKDVAQDSITKVFESIGKFQEAADLTPEKQSKHVRTWLYRIVENAFHDYHRKYHHENSDIDEVKEIGKFISHHEQTAEAQIRSLPKSSRERHSKILKAVEILNDRELRILRAYVKYGKIGEGDEWTLEPDVLAKLASDLNVKPNTIQQTKKRIIDKLRQNLNG